MVCPRHTYSRIYRLDDKDLLPRRGDEWIFFFATAFRPGALSPEREALRSPPRGAKIKDPWSYSSTTP